MGYKSIEQDIKNPDVTVFQTLYDASQRYCDMPALKFMGKSISYNELVIMTENTAKALIAAGVKPGDVVTFMLPNCPQAVAVYYAINRIGAVANMIHTLSAPVNIAFFINKADSRFIVALDSLYPKIKSACEKINDKITVIYTSVCDEIPLVFKAVYKLKTTGKSPAKITDENAFALKKLIRDGKSVTLPPISYKKNRPSTILYSGGSTGRPKGILLSDYNLNSLAIQVANAVGVKISGKKFLSAIPLFHGFGLGVGIHTFMCSGAQCILVPQFNPDSYIKTMVKEKAELMTIIPSILESFLHTDAFDGKDLSFLKGIFCGADTLTADLENRFNRFLEEHNCNETVRVGYGQSEIIAACLLNPIENVKPGSIGLPLGETKVRIVKPGTFEDVGITESGELLINGPAVMLGYLNEPEETANALKTDTDGQVWLFTGDMCKTDGDGYVYFVQRIKRMIITFGYNVYVVQVEAVINACHAVKASCVVGVKDKLLGETVAACVVADEKTDTVSLHGEIIKVCRERLEEYAVPTNIKFIDRLPITNMGKIDFMNIQKLFEKGKREND
ncbi:MAG: acyl--CoA ligase [Clostridia bacterium]|nr:acyl--CoA ligase [Clostridia bacterium]